MNEEARTQAYKEIQRILIERGPVIIPYFSAQFTAVRDSFQGIGIKPFWGRTDLRLVSVAGN